jgi:manganese efflux pump family protein
MFNDLLIIIFIAIGLAMDSFAVSVATSPCFVKINNIRKNLRFAFILGLVQGLFSLFGWLFGHYINMYISGYSNWIAFIILFIIGIKMIIEGFKKPEKIREFNVNNILIALGLAVATSIDALFVGISLSLFSFSVWISALLIAFVTFLFSLLGIKFGKLIRTKLKLPMEIIGGVVLILIGLKIIFV